MIKKYQESKWTFEFTKDGDTFSITNESNNTPKSTNTYEEGKELVTKNSFGQCLKVVKIEVYHYNLLFLFMCLNF